MIYIVSILASVALIFIDQLSKYIISTNLSLNQSITIIDGFFDLTYVRNTGAAWSILEGKIEIFVIVTVIAIALFIIYFIKANKKSILEISSIILMFSGCVGNFIDRISKHYVVDFLDFIIFGYDYPVFNIADCFLVIGVCLYLLKMLLENKNANN